MSAICWIDSGNGYAGSVYKHDSPNAGKWYADAAAISGETGATYTMKAANEGKAIGWRDDVGGDVTNTIELFVPSDIAGLVCWFDAYDDSTFTLVSGDVSEWRSRDGSGTGMKGAQATAGTRPTYNASARNGRPGVVAGNATKYLELNSITALPDLTEPSTVMGVGYCDASGTGYRAIFSWGPNSGNSNRTTGKGSGTFMGHYGSSSSFDYVTTDAWPGFDKIFYDAMNGTTGDFWSNGVDVGGRTFGATYSTIAGGIGRIGAWTTGTAQWWYGVIQEIIVYDSILGSTDREKLEGYHAAKWGLQSLLPSNHPYKNAAPDGQLASAKVTLGAVTATGTMVTPIPLVSEVVLGAVTATGTFQNVVGAVVQGELGSLFVSSEADAFKPVVVNAILGEVVATSEIIGIEDIVANIVLGGLVTTSEMTKTEAVEIRAVLGSMFVEGEMSTNEPGAVNIVLGGIVGRAEAVQYPPGVIEAVLGAVVAQGEFSSVAPILVEGLLGELVCTSVLTEDQPGYLEVEDGTVVPNANSYVTLAFVDNYLESLGYSDWISADTAVREGAIIRATAGIDGIYGKQYPGTKVKGRQQSLLWPRKDATDIEDNEIPEDEIPIELQRAVAEAAYLEWLEPGYLTPNWSTSQLVTQETLGPLSVSYSDPSQFGRGGNQPTLAKIDGILSSLLAIGVVNLFGSTARM